MVLNDTIAAVATPPGEGSIGIIRLSGREAVEIVDKLVETHKAPTIKESASHMLRLGTVVDPDSNERVDEVLVAVMRGPRSFTAEDVVEINCHGGVLAVARVLQLVLRYGARLAEPGEFTRRAFLNGRLDLVQAEAVLSIIRARSARGMEVSLGQLRGDLSNRVNEIGNKVKSVLAAIEASMDFPEEVGDVEESELEKLRDAREQVGKLLATWEEGRLLSEGIKITIIGRTNVGKSSLLNALLNQERAIVSSIPGTTRDTVEESIQIGGFSCRIVDTAGLRDTEDPLENIGVERTYKAVEEADLVLVLIDMSMGMVPEDRDIIEKVRSKNVIIVGNKIDLAGDKTDLHEMPCLPRVMISAKHGTGLDELSDKIREAVVDGTVKGGDGEPLLIRARHRDALEKAGIHLDSAISDWEHMTPKDLIAIDLWATVNYLGEITGATTREDLLNDIFKDFCIGK